MSAEHGTGVGRRRLAVALGITVAALIIEVVGGALSGSLALLADAGHVVTDAVGLIVALVAATVAARPATARHTFGFQRVEVLAALVNGLLLLLVSVLVAVEGVRRLIEPEAPQVAAVPMLVVAAVGLLANAACALILRGGAGESINLRAAYLDVVGDLIGSVLAIAAAVVILLSGFVRADAIASLLVAALIAPRAVLLLRDVVRVLTESAPRETDVEQIRDHLLGTDGVVAVHDVHVWAITSGSPVFTAHVVVRDGVLEAGGGGELLDRLGECLRGHFDVAHSTFQLEPAGRREDTAHR